MLKILIRLKIGGIMILSAAVCLGLLPIIPVQAQEPAAPLYLETGLDKKEAWLGEPVLWKSCLWRCVVLNSNPAYIPPSTDGFAVYALPQIDVDEVRNGRQYVGNTMVSYLIPQRTGRLAVGSVQVQVPRTAVDMTALIEFADFFNGLFRTGGSLSASSVNTALLASPPLSLTVRPLPAEGRPACFSGAVGNYQVQASLSSASVCLDEPFELELRIKGQGNVPLIDAPAGADFPGFQLLQQRVRGEYEGFAPQEDGAARGNTDVPVPAGERTVTYSLLAEKTGEQSLKAPDFAYFDPHSGKYALVPGRVLTLRVRPAEREDAYSGGPQPLSEESLRGVWGGRRLPGWAWAAMVSPLAGWLMLFCVPESDYWSAGSLRRRLRRGLTLPRLWQEWLECHAAEGLRTEQVLEKLRGAGVNGARIERLRSGLGELNRRRFSGAELPDEEEDEKAAWCLLLAELHKTYAARAAVKTSPLKPLYGSRPEAVWKRYHSAAALLTAFLAPLALLVCSGLWLAGAEENAALNAYNRGCLALRSGQTEYAHYLFSLSCRRSGQPEYAEAWRESAARLQLDSVNPPACRRTVLPWWLWASANLPAVFFWINGKRRLSYWLIAAALCGLLTASVQTLHSPLAMVRSGAALRLGPGSNYGAASAAKPGALVWAEEERGGYVRLRRVSHRGDFSAGPGTAGSRPNESLWIDKRGLAYIDGE